MYVNVFFVVRCLYSAVSLALVGEYRFTKKKKRKKDYFLRLCN